MKKFVISVLTGLLSIVCFAQTDVNFQLLAGGDFGPGFEKEYTVSSCKPTLEVTSYGIHHLGYGYFQFAQPFDNNSDNNSGYCQIFWEQNFWENPLMIHGEFRTYYWGGDFHNVWYAGLGYTFQIGKIGYVELEPLYRYQCKIDGDLVSTHHGFQFSIVDGFDWGWVNISNFEDLWIDNQFRLYSETRVFFKIIDRLQIGGYVCLNYNDQWNWTNNKFGVSFLGAIKIVL